jgi:hypothetical protein
MYHMETNNSEHYDSFQGEQYFLTVVETGIPFYYKIPEKLRFVVRFQRVLEFSKSIIAGKALASPVWQQNSNSS